MNSLKLADCCDFYSGGTPEKSNAEYWTGDIPWFSPKDIKSFDLFSARDHVSKASIENSAARLIQAGTILVVARSGVLAKTLPVGIARQSSSFNQDIKAIIPRTGYDSEFIAFYLKAIQAFILKEGVKRGPTVHSLVANFLEGIEIPRTPLTEQRKIVTRVKTQLAKLEIARQAAQAQLRESGMLRSKVIQAAFTGLGNLRQIGSVARLQSGFAFKSESFKTSGLRLLRNTNILPGKVYWDEVVYLVEKDALGFPSYALAKGDVLISLDRPLISSGIKIARVSQADLPALLVQRVGRFLLNAEALDADYLYAFLQSDQFISEIAGHERSLGVPHISPTQVEAIRIPLPPLNEQHRFAARLKLQLTEVDAIQQSAAKQLADISRLPQRLLAQAFNPQGSVP